jgi:hypothetical protein
MENSVPFLVYKPAVITKEVVETIISEKKTKCGTIFFLLKVKYSYVTHTN